ncbi:ABC transporter permease [Paenibacillus tarimensis]
MNGQWMSKWRKYEAVMLITLRHQLAYKADFLLRSVFLLLILFIFIQLWQAAYEGDSSRLIAGFSLKQIIWYLVFTEALTMAGPQLGMRVEEEVKNGEIAVRLTRPLSYTGFHYMCYTGEAYLRFAVHLAVGSVIATALIGPPSFGGGWAALLIMSIGSFTVAYMLSMIVALCAFWVEETRGLEFVMQKLQFTVGGMLIPLDLMPEWLQRICLWLPFQAVLYFPAKIAVSYDSRLFAEFITIQWGWVILLSVLLAIMYRSGVRKLHVNGG